MLKVLRTFLNSLDSLKYAPSYDEDGTYIPPEMAKLGDKDLTINADKARIMMTKAIEEKRLRDRKRIFQKIHMAIKGGKTNIRLESYQTNEATLTYFADLGYVIATVSRPEQGMASLFDDDGEEVAQPNTPYFYYTLSWNTPATTVPVTETSVVTPVAEAVAQMSLNS